MEYVFVILYTTWFILVVLNHVDGMSYINRLQRWDRFALLPNWSFFTNHMGTTDVFLLSRERNGETTTSWENMDVGKRKGRIRLVYPKRRIRVAVSRIRHVLKHTLSSNDGESTRVKRTFPYLLLLRYVLSRRGDPDDSEHREYQFLLAVPSPEESRNPVHPRILSSFHKLGAYR